MPWSKVVKPYILVHITTTIWCWSPETVFWDDIYKLQEHKEGKHSGIYAILKIDEGRGDIQPEGYTPNKKITFVLKNRIMVVWKILKQKKTDKQTRKWVVQ